MLYFDMLFSTEFMDIQMKLYVAVNCLTVEVHHTVHVEAVFDLHSQIVLHCWPRVSATSLLHLAKSLKYNMLVNPEVYKQ